MKKEKVDDENCIPGLNALNTSFLIDQFRIELSSAFRNVFLFYLRLISEEGDYFS